MKMVTSRRLLDVSFRGVPRVGVLDCLVCIVLCMWVRYMLAGF